MKENFVVPLNGLAAGKTTLLRHAGKEFFEEYGNTEILDADVDVEITIEKSGRYIGVDCIMRGTLTVPCDRCMEDLVCPVDGVALLSVKFMEGASTQSEDATEDGREIIALPESDSDLDLSQTVYDYSYLSLPLKKVHPDGGCNPEALKYISGEEPVDAKAPDSPFTALKDILKK
jgi:uncharacterized metal-binding protein YceD (DUF177 family)